MKKFTCPLLYLLILCGSGARADALKFPEFDFESDCQKWRSPELVGALHNDGGRLARFSPDELVQACLDTQKRDKLAAQMMWGHSSRWAQENALVKAEEDTEIISPEAPKIFFTYLKKYLTAYANSSQ